MIWHVKFYELEKADIPRAWTGEVFAALYKRHGMRGIWWPTGASNTVSALMKPMTNDQRTTFLQLLPTWKGDLDKLASVAKKLYKR